MLVPRSLDTSYCNLEQTCNHKQIIRTWHLNKYIKAYISNVLEFTGFFYPDILCCKRYSLKIPTATSFIAIFGILSCFRIVIIKPLVEESHEFSHSYWVIRNWCIEFSPDVGDGVTGFCCTGWTTGWAEGRAGGVKTGVKPAWNVETFESELQTQRGEFGWNQSRQEVVAEKSRKKELINYPRAESNLCQCKVVQTVRGVQTTKIIVIPGTWKPGDISRWEDVRVSALTTVDFVIHTVHDTVTASAACDALSAAALELVCCTRRAGAGASVALQHGDALQMFKITSYFCRVRAWNSLECSPFFVGRLNPFTSSNKTG